MDLRNNQITVRELLADPKARQVLAASFPRSLTGPCGKIRFHDPGQGDEIGGGLRTQKSHSGDLGGAQAAVTGTGRESPALT